MVFLIMLKALLFTYLYYLGSKLVTTFVIIAIFNYYLHNHFPDEMQDIREQVVSLFEPHIKLIDSMTVTVSYNVIYTFSYLEIQVKKIYKYLSSLNYVSQFLNGLCEPSFKNSLQVFDVFGRLVDSTEQVYKIKECENGVEILCNFIKYNATDIDTAYLQFMHNKEVYIVLLDNNSIKNIDDKCINDNCSKLYKNIFNIQFSKVRFLSAQIRYKNNVYDLNLCDPNLVNPNYYVVGNKIDHRFVLYYLNIYHNIYESVSEYTVHIVDQNVNIFQLDKTQTLTFTIDGYTLTKNNEEKKDKEEKKDNEEKKERAVSDDDDSVNFVKISGDDIAQVK